MRKSLFFSVFFLVLISVLFKVAYENSEALMEIVMPVFTGEGSEVPVASFTYTPGYPYMGDPVTFNASDSYDTNGTIVSYFWDFGDDTSLNETDPIATHVYMAAGNYAVTLTVRDNEGFSDIVTKTITVKQAPIAVFTYSPWRTRPGQTVTFNASNSNDPNGYIVSYVWNFGDENITTTNTPIITHVYTAEGNYAVFLNVTDNEGYVDTATNMVWVRNYPTASFIYSPEFPFVNETVTFNASSSTPNGGSITSYGWNFGDGNITIVNTPIITHVYNASGNYTVILAVTDDEGLSDYKSKTIWIRSHPIAAFFYTPIAPFAGDNVTFYASPSTANGGVIVSYLWDFGDGSQPVNETDPITTHIYNAGGNYAVTLTVKDNNGNTGITTSTIKVRQFPVASFTYTPNFPIASEMTTFNASDSYDADGYIVSYEWDFGDGNITTETTATTTHTYMSSGNYTVAVVVTDNDGLTDTATYTVRVRGYPTANFTWSPLPPQVSELVTFNASSSTPEGGVILSYEWDFGDGNITTVFDPVIVHNYRTFGYYYVTLTVVDNEGLSGNESKTVQVIAAPEANFTWQPSVPLVNETVTFDASTSVPNGGTIMLYKWNFGDGSPPVLVLIKATITHQYTALGNYTITLTVTDTENLSDTASKAITVTLAYPQADFTWSPQSSQAYETVTFDASKSLPNGGAIISYEWDFGDGKVTSLDDPIVTHCYDTAGEYFVTLKVTDSEGLSDTISQTLSILAPTEPQARFYYLPYAPYVLETITFNASASTPGVGTIINYTWNFGDGNIAIVNIPIITHVYNASGNYTVILTVTNIAGLSNTTSRTMGILPISGPNADFTWSPFAPQPNRTITFDASGSTPGWNGTHHPPIAYYTWGFGDGNMTTVTEPLISHIYPAEGNYTITLTVTDVNGWSNSIMQIIEVKSRPIYDINGDGVVDIKDVAIVAKAYGSYHGDPNWNPNADLNGDGKVDIKDIATVAIHYGEYV